MCVVIDVPELVVVVFNACIVVATDSTTHICGRCMCRSTHALADSHVTCK